MMSSSDEKELQAALSCKRKRRRWWKHEINEKRERLGEYHRLCVELQSHEDSRTFSITFSVTFPDRRLQRVAAFGPDTHPSCLHLTSNQQQPENQTAYVVTNAIVLSS